VVDLTNPLKEEEADMQRKIFLIIIGIILLGGLATLAFAEEAAEAAKVTKNLGVYFGAALAIGLPALATGYAQAKIGAAGAGALAERPELVGPIIVLIAIPETAVILGFVISILIMG
jgi:V/A-type H+-transporting ATPase subunit K